MKLNLSTPFTRLDQIQFIESEIRRLQFVNSPTKNKKIAMLEDIAIELRKLSEPNYPNQLMCAKLDYVFDNNIVSAGWYLTDMNQDFDSCLDNYIKTQQNKARKFIRSASFVVKPKLELFKLGSNLLVHGMALVKSPIGDYIYDEVDSVAIQNHNKHLSDVMQLIEENNFMDGLSRDIPITDLFLELDSAKTKPESTLKILKHRDPSCTPKLELYTDFQNLNETIQENNGSQ